MRLYIKQHVWSFRDKFYIKDEFGNDIYFVEGELFSFGHKLHIYNNQSQEVVYIKQKPWSFLPKYEVYMNNVMVAHIVKDFTFFEHKYVIEGTNLVIEGDFFAHDYRILDGNYVVAYINKAWFTWGDSYEINVADPVNALLTIACVLTIDCSMASNNNGG